MTPKKPAVVVGWVLAHVNPLYAGPAAGAGIVLFMYYVLRVKGWW